MHTQLALVLVYALIHVGAITARDTKLHGCMDTCGNVSIPYPFGVGTSETGENCFFEQRLNLTCQDNILYWGVDLQVLEISLKGQMDLLFFVSKLCNDTPNGVANKPCLISPIFTISSKENKFINVGCETFGYLNSFYNGVGYSTGCLTRCTKFPDIATNGHCSGIGCCEVNVPPSMKNITIESFRFRSSNFQSCSHSFVAKHGSYNFDINHIVKLPFDRMPMVVDWSVGDKGCEFVRNGSVKSACMKNSHCHDIDISHGYQCRCKTGYDGNPYHPNGCQDIDECKTKRHTCISENHCLNTDGSYECFCPPGQVGDGKFEEGCRPIQRQNSPSKFAIGNN
ncbi:unnamed protein product [Sphenostylis stenocarpa]|uniref:EGF-like domain-containing protein n=1 Tax=Sphenostylis stenocarpa TaxID=92480 RepID=A0AA86T966_9FABA|nr:unnamed protein product [Sphenostylis stenocarpa]